MGRPKLYLSFDSLITYPMLVVPAVPHFSHVHPIEITVVNFVFKFLSLYAMINEHFFLLFIFSIVERWLDCLDGEVARVFSKTSRLGHLMDKGSDFLFRWFTAIYLVFTYVHSFPVAPVATSVLILLCVGCPGLYVYDAWHGHIEDGNTKRTGVSIYLEDNATLLCFVQPLLLWAIA